MFSTLLILMLPLMTSSSTELKFDFGTGTGGTDWEVINDGVMGGLSQGKMSLTENSLLYQGNISLRNNGGFSSLKSPFKRFDLSGFTQVEMRFRATGQAFAMTLEQDQRFYMPNFKYEFRAQTGKWTTIRVPLADFQQYRMGRALGNKMTTVSLQNTLRIGLISNEKREGDFQIEIDYIAFQ